MKTVGNLVKKAVKWYFNAHAYCYNENYKYDIRTF